MRHRESDSLIVPVKAGNAAGGKEATYGSAVRGNTNRSQKRGTMETKLHRIAEKAGCSDSL